jgi:hypothetical protein
MAALMTREEIAAAYRAALERVRGRRNEYVPVSERERREAWLEGRELPRHDWRAPAFRAPVTLGEWADDVVVAWGQPGLQGDPATPVIIGLAEASRDGAAAAAGALKAARGLPPASQWAVYQNLQAWRTDDGSGRLGTDLLALALLDEWGKLRLATEDPATATPGRRRRRPWEIEAEAAS